MPKGLSAVRWGHLPWHWYSLALVLLVLDQLTKRWAVASLGDFAPVEVTPFFNLTLRYNYGAAFSFLHDAGGWQRWFFGIIATGVSIFIVVWLSKLKRAQWMEALGLACILGGALGNLYDRIALGYVVDFIELHYQQQHYFPAFNIADSAITVGAALLILDMFRSKKTDE
jgi:signal peptidase II